MSVDQATAASKPIDHFHSRRRGPRVEVLGQLHGELVPLDVPLIVHNLGIGGFAIESVLAFPRGVIHSFRFTTPSDVKIVISASAAHCRVIEGTEGDPRYLSGFEFIRDTGAQTDRSVEILLDAVTSVLMFQ